MIFLPQGGTENACHEKTRQSWNETRNVHHEIGQQLVTGANKLFFVMLNIKY